MIKHLVISGGGPTGFLTYGAARYLCQQNYWNVGNIDSIYGTSIGAFLGIVLSLGLPWNFLDKYFIDTKWDKVLNLKPYNFIDAYSSKGIIQPNFIKDSIEPLLLKKGINKDVTMKEFYNYNKIDLHLFTTDINSDLFETIDLSHKTHPDLILSKALEMSTAYPILFKPVFENKSCFIDGGLLNNLPVNDCLEQTNCKIEDVLVFKNDWSKDKLKVRDNSSIIDFLLIFFLKLVEFVNTEEKQLTLPNTVNFEMNKINNFKKGSFNSWVKSINDKENRIYLINMGEKYAKELLRNKK